VSFLTRVRLAIVRWWIRNSESRHAPDFQDLEGIGRALARPSLQRTDQNEDLSPPVSVTRRREARFPNRLVIRFE
jgi:hypothetical protein